VNDATVLATVTNPLGNKEEIPMDWILSEEGVYVCRYLPTDEGNYDIKVHVTGWDLPPAESAFEVSEPYIEFSSAGLKEEVLRGMARTTGGKYFTYAEAKDLPDLDEPPGQGRQRGGIQAGRPGNLGHPALFTILLLVLAAEWFVRRRSGLA